MQSGDRIDANWAFCYIYGVKLTVFVDLKGSIPSISFYNKQLKAYGP